MLTLLAWYAQFGFTVTCASRGCACSGVWCGAPELQRFWLQQLLLTKGGAPDSGGVSSAGFTAFAISRLESGACWLDLVACACWWDFRRLCADAGLVSRSCVDYGRRRSHRRPGAAGPRIGVLPLARLRACVGLDGTSLKSGSASAWHSLGSSTSRRMVCPLLHDIFYFDILELVG